MYLLNGRTHIFEASVWIAKERARVFEFFSDPQNLERITPPWLKFKVLDQSTPTMVEGTEFSYRLKVHGVPARWRSRIEQWQPNEKFVDIQLSGPYRSWVHTHRFIDEKGGTTMIDHVEYTLPLRAIGDLVALRFVKKDVQEIFDYRNRIVRELLA